MKYKSLPKWNIAFLPLAKLLNRYLMLSVIVDRNIERIRYKKLFSEE